MNTNNYISPVLATFVSSPEKNEHTRHLQVLILLNATLCAACLQTFHQPHNNAQPNYD